MKSSRHKQGYPTRTRRSGENNIDLRAQSCERVSDWSRAVPVRCGSGWSQTELQSGSSSLNISLQNYHHSAPMQPALSRLITRDLIWIHLTSFTSLQPLQSAEETEDGGQIPESAALPASPCLSGSGLWDPSLFHADLSKCLPIYLTATSSGWQLSPVKKNWSENTKPEQLLSY